MIDIFPEDACGAGKGAERRASCQVLSRWLDRRRQEEVPTEDAFDLEGLSEVEANVFVIDPGREEGHWILSRCGKAVAETCLTQPLGECATRAFPWPLGEQLPDLCRNAIAYRKPIFGSGSAFGPKGEVLYRCIVMPLSKDGASVIRLLGSLSYRRTTLD